MPKKKKSARATKSKPKLKLIEGELKGEPMNHHKAPQFSYGAHHAPRKLHAVKTRAS